MGWDAADGGWDAAGAQDSWQEADWKQADWSAAQETKAEATWEEAKWDESASWQQPEQEASWGETKGQDQAQAADSWGAAQASADTAGGAQDASWNNWDSKEAGAADAAATTSTQDASWNDWGSKEAKADTGGQNSWGDWGSKEASATPPATDFWETQKWNKENGTLSRKADWEVERDDQELFVERLGTNAGLCFDKYESVPVDLSGNKSNLIPVCRTFAELYEAFGALIPQALVENVQRCRYTTPTPVQKYAIPAGLASRDIMCCAQTGSGKTAAFLMPVIGRMMKTNERPTGQLTEPFEGPCEPDTLVMTPTRELCVQIYEEAMKFCHRTDFRAVRIYGGEKPKVQLMDIALGADLMVATPGRLGDFINRGVVKMECVSTLVLDEADRMLDMGFEPQIRAIVEEHGMPTKEERQTMMFSATFPETCQKMAQDFLYDYIWIGVGVVGGAVDTVEQRLEKVSPKDKYQKLIELLDDFFTKRESENRALVFVNAKDTAKWLDEQLYEKHMDTGALHGNLTQEERERNLSRFRKGEIDVMIATDVAARGLDIANVSQVINYDMPTDIDSYIHRIGRTGRIGNQGTAITFISCDENTGDCLENVENLKKLLQVMQDSKASVPDWLEGTIEAQNSAGGGRWRWGGQDVRDGQETYRYNGADSWSNWKGSAAAEDQQQQQQQDDPWKW